MVFPFSYSYSEVFVWMFINVVIFSAFQTLYIYFSDSCFRNGCGIFMFKVNQFKLL